MDRRCPKCRKPIPPQDEKASFAPFCSDRCRLLDLGAWLDGDYRIPASDSAPAMDDEGGGSGEPH